VSALETNLGPGREFDRIRLMAARWRGRARGLGDDCAFIEAGGERLAVSTDLSIEGVHFRREWLTPGEIGYRAVAAALSDLAAVAAEPLAVLLSFGIPEWLDDAGLEELAAGAGDAAGDAGAVIAGGDTSRSPQLICDACVVGRAAAPVLRRGARPGDVLVVSGTLGASAAALEGLLAGAQPPAALRARFARPPSRHALARFLAAHGARAMIDISDGLAADLGHLLAAGETGASLDVAALPVHPAAAEWAAARGEEPWRLAARSGEEYELIAALPPSVADDRLAAAPVALARIGVVEAEVGLRAHLAGAPVSLPPGFDHFGT
jgi:thiamine-monophosphate kinase